MIPCRYRRSRSVDRYLAHSTDVAGEVNFKTARKRDPQWRAFPEDAPTWCPYSNLGDLPQAIQRFAGPNEMMEHDHDSHEHCRCSCILVHGGVDADTGAGAVLR